MSSEVCFLVTLLCGGALVRCALKADQAAAKGDWWQYPMEPENREIIAKLLPEHVRECGYIVEVEPIFEVYVATGGAA